MSSQGLNIPVSKARRVSLKDQGQLDALLRLKNKNFQFSVNGTMFDCTPGGTRIYYDRDFMVNLASSPAAKSMPAALPDLPGVVLHKPHAMPAPSNGAITVITEENSEDKTKSKDNSLPSPAPETIPVVIEPEMELEPEEDDMEIEFD
jgi:hypothetical protein